MDGKRLVVLFGGFVLAFTVVLGRCAVVGSNTAYAQAAQGQLVTSLPLGMARGNFYDAQGVPLTGYSSRDLLCALGLAVFCTLLGHSVYSWALKYETAAFISAAKLLEPAYASVLAAILFREVLTLQTGIGALLIIGGILYYVRHPAETAAVEETS